jgi:hypothetical protein
MIPKRYPQRYPLPRAPEGVAGELSLTEALAASCAEADRLRARNKQLEAVARLNGETIRAMQRAATEAASAPYRRAPPQR